MAKCLDEISFIWSAMLTWRGSETQRKGKLVCIMSFIAFPIAWLIMHSRGECCSSANFSVYFTDSSPKKVCTATIHPGIHPSQSQLPDHPANPPGTPLNLPSVQPSLPVLLPNIPDSHPALEESEPDQDGFYTFTVCYDEQTAQIHSILFVWFVMLMWSIWDQHHCFSDLQQQVRN